MLCHVSPDFPLNRRMRKAVARGKLQLIRVDDRLGGGGGTTCASVGIPFRAVSSPLVCCVAREGENGGGVGGKLNDELLAFKIGLEKIVGNPCVKQRPFVCDGSPLDCKICLAGINPATDMHDNFWNFWDNARGFNREEWLRAYVRSRERDGKKKFGNSRERIERIIKSANPVDCLETNLFSAEAWSEDTLKKEDKNSAAFNFLLREIKGMRIIAVFTKGADNQDSVLRALDARSANSRVVEEFDGKMFQREDGLRVVFVKHYKFWSYADACKFGEWLRKQAEDAPRRA